MKPTCRGCPSDLRNEVFSADAVALTEMRCNHKLEVLLSAMNVQASPAEALFNALDCEAALFAANERPNLVQFQIADTHLMNLFCQKLFAAFTGELQNVQHGA